MPFTANQIIAHLSHLKQLFASFLLILEVYKNEII